MAKLSKIDSSVFHNIIFPSDTGNNDVMDGVQIIEDYLYGVTETREGANLIVDSTPKEPLTIYADDHTECKEECQSRYIFKF